jgi:membrane protein implicated in regulation of membrane protease activity
MYGSWMGVTLGAIGVVLLVIAAMLTAWTPIFAFMIFAVIATFLLVLAAMRRSAEASTPGAEDHAGDPERYAAPASGEGGGHGDGDPGPEPVAPRLEDEPAGIWGEKR